MKSQPWLSGLSSWSERAGPKLRPLLSCRAGRLWPKAAVVDCSRGCTVGQERGCPPLHSSIALESSAPTCLKADPWDHTSWPALAPGPPRRPFPSGVSLLLPCVPFCLSVPWISSASLGSLCVCVSVWGPVPRLGSMCVVQIHL